MMIVASCLSVLAKMLRARERRDEEAEGELLDGLDDL